MLDRLHTPYAKTDTAERVHLFVSLAVFVILAIWAVGFVPMNNDEAHTYHVLSCLAPHAQTAADLQECDGASDLKTPFGFTLPRTNPYTGVTAAALYAPVFFLFRLPEAQYAFGLICFAVFAWLMAQLTAKPLRSFPVFLSFFPFVFNFVHDMGPVHNTLLLFPVSVWLARKILARGPAAYGYAALLSVLAVLAVEEKIFFVYLLPAFAFFILAFLGKNLRDEIKTLLRAWRPLLLCKLLFLALFTALMLSTKTNAPHAGMTYFAWLRLMTSGNTAPLYDIASLSMFEKWFRFLLFWPHYAGRFFVTNLADMQGNPVLSFTAFMTLITLPALLFAGGIGGTVAVRWKPFDVMPRHRLIFLLLCFAACAATFTFFGGVWAGHHFVFIWLPLLAIACDLIACLDGPLLIAASLLLAAANLAPALWLTQADLHYEVSRERAAVDAYFTPARTAHAVIAYESWGYHFIQRDYGAPERMIFITPFRSPASAQRLDEILAATGRDFYMVCRAPDPDNTLERLIGDSCNPKMIEGEIYACSAAPQPRATCCPILKSGMCSRSISAPRSRRLRNAAGGLISCPSRKKCLRTVV